MANVDHPNETPMHNSKESTPPIFAGDSRHWTRRKRWQLPIIFCILGAIALAFAWASRKEIADDYIVQQLEALGLEATYEVAEIGPERQVLRNVVIGDPENPDLTIEEIAITISLVDWTPGLDKITLVRPRIYGSFTDGKLSFGALDPFLFAESDEPFALPEFDINLIDGRGLFQSDYGDLGIKLEGEGVLSDGFAGIVAVAAPELAAEGCALRDASIFGDIAIDNGVPSFSGPIRAALLFCPTQEFQLRGLSIEAELIGTSDFDGVDARGGLDLATLTYSGTTARTLDGDITLGFGADASAAEESPLTNVKYDLTSGSVVGAGWGLANLRLDGGLRVRGAFERSEIDVEVSGENIRAGEGAIGALAQLQEQTGGTLAAPLIAKLRRGLAELGRANRLSAAVIARQTGSIITATIPEARLRNAGGTGGARGDSALALSQVQFTTGGASGGRLTGNFVTAGRDLPQMSGRMEQRSGALVMRMSMSEFAAEGASISLPELSIRQDASGRIQFNGSLLASGDVPNGRISGLSVPISGRYSQQAGLALWEECVSLSYRALKLNNIDLAMPALRLCPNGNRAIVNTGANGVQFGAQTAGIKLGGSLEGTPFKLSTGGINVNWPGSASASNVTVTLGTDEVVDSFSVAELSMELSSDISGRFSGAEIRLDAVPMDIFDAEGQWSYSGGVLMLEEGNLRIIDREEIARFKPLVVRGATMMMTGDEVKANALMRNEETDRVLSVVDIMHDLSTGVGNAALTVDNLVFETGFQPENISVLTEGVIALVKGRIDGQGLIEWTPDSLKSGGTFGTKDLDLAAAFGPVAGASGTITFIDLIGLTTAPNQKVLITSINPGIEVLEGEITYEIRDAQVVKIKEAEWPFMGGKLIMEPVTLDFSQSEARRYEFTMEGLDAAAFVSQMEFSNLSATGKFNGSVPIIFDVNGDGRIEGSVLDSQSPGGNVSYVGALTYEDMGFISNFAFNMLKSIDYTGMQIRINGPLTGNLVTQVEIDGVQQGEEASRNILTREIAKLPIKLNINVNAPFYQLMTSMRSLYDPEFVDSAALKKLLDEKDQPVGGDPRPTDPTLRPDDINQTKQPIQLEESDTKL